MIRRLTPLLVIVLFAPTARGQSDPLPGSVSVHPAPIEIKHHRHPIGIQVLGASRDGFSLDLRKQAKFAVANRKIATVDADGWVRPVANGQTTISVGVAGVFKDV